MSSNPCYDFLNKLKCNTIEFRKYGGNITVEPVNDSQIAEIRDYDSRLFLYYYFGYLKNKKEVGLIDVHDIRDVEFYIQDFIFDCGGMEIVDFAMIRGDITMLEWLIAIDLDISDYCKQDMVVTSIMSNSVDMLEWIINLNGPNFNLRDHYPGNLLKFALEKKCSYDMIKYLFNYGVHKPLLSLTEKNDIRESYNNEELWDRIVELLDL